MKSPHSKLFEFIPYYIVAYNRGEEIKENIRTEEIEKWKNYL